MAVSLEVLSSKVEAGEPLSDKDIQFLGATRDIIALGMMATTVRRKLHGTDVTFVRVADLKIADLKVGTTTPTGAMPPPIGVVPSFRSAGSAGEIRIFETPQTLDEAVDVVSRALDRA